MKKILLISCFCCTLLLSNKSSVNKNIAIEPTNTQSNNSIDLAKFQKHFLLLTNSSEIYNGIEIKKHLKPYSLVKVKAEVLKLKVSEDNDKVILANKIDKLLKEFKTNLKENKVYERGEEFLSMIEKTEDEKLKLKYVNNFEAFWDCVLKYNKGDFKAASFKIKAKIINKNKPKANFNKFSLNKRRRLPEELGNDPVLIQLAKSICLKRYGSKQDMEIRICSVKWHNYFNKLDELTHRSRRGCMLYKEDGKCILQYFFLREDYSNGKFSNTHIAPGVFEDKEEYDCELNKN